ncbi:MAG: helix-turn-helix transcriptional regulator [Cyanobacteria bacterium P01_H01_bin.105]
MSPDKSQTVENAIVSADLQQSRNHALEKFIKELGLNQASFAKRIGVKRATVNGWVTRGKVPSAALLVKIAAEFEFEKGVQALNRRLGFNLDLTSSSEVEQFSTLISRLKNVEKEVEILKSQAI